MNRHEELTRVVDSEMPFPGFYPACLPAKVGATFSCERIEEAINGVSGGEIEQTAPVPAAGLMGARWISSLNFRVK
jgi:hypothetical protein